MAGNPIGIRAKLSLDQAQLAKDIEKIQALVSKNGGDFKVNINEASLEGLKQLQTLVKEITTMAGKGIKVKVDVDYGKISQIAKPKEGASVEEYKAYAQAVSDLANKKIADSTRSNKTIADDSKKTAKDVMLSYEELVSSYRNSIGTVTRETIKMSETTNQELSTTLEYLDELKNKQSYTITNSEEPSVIGTEIKAYADSEKKIDALRTRIEALKVSYSTMTASGSTSIKAQETSFVKLNNLMDKLAKNPANSDAYAKAVKIAEEDENRNKRLSKQLTLVDSLEKKYTAMMNSSAKKDGLINDEQMQSFRTAIDALGKVTSVGQLDIGAAKLNTEMTDLANSTKKFTDTIKGVGSAGDVTKKLNGYADAVAKLRNQFQSLTDGGAKDDNGVGQQIAQLESALSTMSTTSVTSEQISQFDELSLAAKTSIESMSKTFELASKIKEKQNSLGNDVANLKKFADVLPTGQLDEFNKKIESLGNVESVEQLDAQAKQLKYDISGASREAKDMMKNVANSGSASHGLKKISDELAKFGLYFSAWRLTSEVLQEFKRGIGVVAELDNQIVQVGIDMNITSQQSSQLVKDAQRIAAETGIAIDQVVRVAGVYSNANETMESVMAKVKPSAILAGVAGADASVITDMFQGVINQYKLAQGDIEGISYDISDSIIAVSKNLSKNFDTSVTDISDSMLEAGAIMESMGYTYQETMALVGATIEVTRQSGSEMGGALKMIGARIGGAKDTGEDVAPEEVSKAAEAYHKLGIEIVNADDSFKPMKDTLGELSQQWDTMTDVEKSYIAEMSAGNRRRNTFVVMMNTMAKQQELTNIAMNSGGETLKTNEKYLESTQAKVQNFTNALDTLWQDTLSSDAIKGIVDFGTGVLNLGNAMGGMTIIISGVAAALIMHSKVVSFATISQEALALSGVSATKGMVSLAVGGEVVTASFNKTAVASVLLKGAMSMLLAVGIGLVIKGLSWLIDKLIKTQDEIDETSASLKAEGDEALDISEKLKKLVSEQGKLESSIKAGRLTTDEATEAKERLAEIYKEIATIAPEAGNAWDEENRLLATNLDLTLKVAEAKAQEAKAKAGLWLEENKVSKGYIEYSNIILSKDKERLKMLEQLSQKGQETYTIEIPDEDPRSATFGQNVKYELNVKGELAKLTTKMMEDEAKRAEIRQQMINAGWDSVEVLKMESMYGSDSVISAEEMAIALAKANDALTGTLKTSEELDKSFDSSLSKVREYGNIIDEINDKDRVKNGDSLEAGSIEYILENAPHLIQYLGDEKRLKEELIALQAKEGDVVKQNMAAKLFEMSEVELAQFKTMNAKTENDEDYYDTVVKNNAELIKRYYEAYGVDLRNYNSLAQAKNAVDIKYLKSAAFNYSEFYKSLNRASTQAASQISGLAGKVSGVSKLTGNDGFDGLSAVDQQHMKKLIDLGQKLAMGGSLEMIDALSFVGTGFNGVSTPKSANSSGSGSDKDDQVYESDVAQMNWYTHMVEDYQKKLEKLNASISNIKTEIKSLQDIGTDKSLASAISKENELYATEEKRFALLKEERQAIASNMSALQNSINSKYGNIDMSSRTTESLNYYLDTLFPQISSTSQKVVDARNAQREQFTQMFNDYMMLSDEYMSVDEEYLSMESELTSIIKERYDMEFELINRGLEAKNKEVQAYKDKLDLLNDSAKYGERESLMAGELQSLIKYRDAIQSTLQSLTQQLSKVSENTMEWTIINDKVTEYKDTLQDANVSVGDMQESLKSLIDAEYSSSMSLMDKLAAVIRKEYEDAKEAELTALKSALDAEMAVKEKQIQVLQDRLDALNDTTADKQAELRGLYEEQQMWEKDDSVKAKAQLAELNKLIAEKEKELEKDAIQDEIDKLQTDKEDYQTSYEDKLTVIDEFYKQLTGDQNVYSQAQLVMASMAQDQILAMLLSQDEKYKGMGSVLGKAFAEGLMEEILKGTDSLKELTNGLTGSNMIPNLSNLPSSYAYNNATSGYIAPTTGVLGISNQATSNLVSDSVYRALSGVSSKQSLNPTNIGEISYDMVVNFYTNGQYDVDKSIDSLDKMLEGKTVGSGYQLSLSVNR